MSKKSIEERVKDLSEKEAKIKKQLDSDSDEMKEKAIRVGKIALIVGGVALIGYWLFNIFSEDEDIVEEKKPKKKKNKRSAPHVNSRITALLMPYLNKFLDGILDDDAEEKTNPKKKIGIEDDD